MNKFISFTSDISNVSLPKKFDYPHNYTPHLLAKIASKELQEYLINQKDFTHNFGLKNTTDKNAIGKMFGVLIVKNNQHKIGYLAAFSGKLANSTQHKKFVPPVYDVLSKNGFYLKTEEKLNSINSKLSALKNNIDFLTTQENYLATKTLNNNLLNFEKLKIKSRRKKRKEEGKQNNQLNINEEFYLREYQIYLNQKNQLLEKKYNNYLQQINYLKQQRKEISATVQEQIFSNYQFLNIHQKTQNLLEIFTESIQNIPAGAGDCCAPKLLQYAFLNNLTPICMAEFWWGKPLTTSVRKHLNFYTACNGKCKPILKHMLIGLQVDKNPLTTEFNQKKEIEIIFEDNYLAVINKPHELLSVEGKEIKDSVYNRVKKMFPEAIGPSVVHRLDMATSGILLIAKSNNIYKNLQSQFINRTIKKRYIALLDGVLPNKKGKITLPLRVDLNDRPKQLVCDVHGKKAITKWEVIDTKNNKTKVYFYPITGRTHQLRLHAAHHLGLNAPIVGDDLYGTKANRLFLHAEKIEFTHPITKKIIEFTSPVPF